MFINSHHLVVFAYFLKVEKNNKARNKQQERRKARKRTKDKEKNKKNKKTKTKYKNTTVIRRF